MLKIAMTDSEHGVLTIRVAGRLTPEGCEALERALYLARDGYQEVRIDLANIQLVDQPSIEYLACLQRRHIELLNVPSYVSRWIQQVSKRRGFDNVGEQSDRYEIVLSRRDRSKWEKQRRNRPACVDGGNCAKAFKY